MNLLADRMEPYLARKRRQHRPKRPCRRRRGRDSPVESGRLRLSSRASLQCLARGACRTAARCRLLLLSGKHSRASHGKHPCRQYQTHLSAARARAGAPHRPLSARSAGRKRRPCWPSSATTTTRTTRNWLTGNFDDNRAGIIPRRDGVFWASLSHSGAAS